MNMHTLFRSILKEASKFKDYNFRKYVIRRAKEDFKTMSEEPLRSKWEEELEIIKR